VGVVFFPVVMLLSRVAHGSERRQASWRSLPFGIELDALAGQMHKGGILYAEAVREFRKVFISTVLRENKGNQTRAARELGMHRNTLSRMVSALRLDIRALRPSSRRPPGREPSLSAVRKMSH
jgi:Fis family transcriptional regulator, factor for inversion stimulation protein